MWTGVVFYDDRPVDRNTNYEVNPIHPIGYATTQ